MPSVRLARLADEAAAALVAPPDPDPVGWSVLPPAAVAELQRVVDASLADASKAAYRADWRRFTGWAADGGYPSLPAGPAVVAAYVSLRPERPRAFALTILQRHF